MTCKSCQKPVDRPHVSPDHCTWCLAVALAKERVGRERGEEAP